MLFLLSSRSSSRCSPVGVLSLGRQATGLATVDVCGRRCGHLRLIFDGTSSSCSWAPSCFFVAEMMPTTAPAAARSSESCAWSGLRLERRASADRSAAVSLDRDSWAPSSARSAMAPPLSVYARDASHGSPRASGGSAASAVRPLAGPSVSCGIGASTALPTGSFESSFESAPPMGAISFEMMDVGSPRASGGSAASAVRPLAGPSVSCGIGASTALSRRAALRAPSSPRRR